MNLFRYTENVSQGDSMLTVEHVTKKYGKVLAVDDVSFQLDDGSVTVLLGPNGAGKSTLMKSIIGFLKYQGDIRVMGIPAKTTKAREILGYIPEMPVVRTPNASKW